MSGGEDPINSGSWLEFNSGQADGTNEVASVPVVLPRAMTAANPVVESVFEAGYEYDFFQAVSLLEQIFPDRPPVGKLGRSSRMPSMRFGADASATSFAASAVHEILPIGDGRGSVKMIVGFMGLTGPAGILPPHYTERLRLVEYERRDAERYALREWLDLFNNRFIALFYLSWKKYRPYAAYRESLRPTHGLIHENRFTHVLWSVMGLGSDPLVAPLRPLASIAGSHSAAPRMENPPQAPNEHDQPSDASSVPRAESTRESHAVNVACGPDQCCGESAAPVSGIEHLALIRWAGLLAQRPRNTSNLQQLLEDFFQLPFRVQSFRGNWLNIDDDAQSQLGVDDGNSTLGVDAVVGNQTWERQNKILLQLGPLTREQFTSFMPDHPAQTSKNLFSLMSDLTRLYVGPEFDVDVQVILHADQLPAPSLSSEAPSGLRLGWNTWLEAPDRQQDATDAIFCNVSPSD